MHLFPQNQKIESSLLIFTPKQKIFKFNNPKSLEKITRFFFGNDEKKLKERQ